jgi:rubredoxin
MNGAAFKGKETIAESGEKFSIRHYTNFVFCTIMAVATWRCENQKGGRTMAKRYICSICGYVYDEEQGAPEVGIEPRTPFSQLPDTFTCPLCSMGKDVFHEE